MKYIFMFDIDETLLSTLEKSRSYLNNVPYEVSQFNPYKLLGMRWNCITLNKKEMNGIFKEILQNGYAIGFITNGGLEESDMKSFFLSEYEINLENFMHYNYIHNKTSILKNIAENHSLPYSNIFFIDNDKLRIADASQAGFNTIYVDNNRSDKTHGTEHIKKLRSTISDCLTSDANKINSPKEEKKSGITQENSEIEPLINSSKEALSDGYSETHAPFSREEKEQIDEECARVANKINAREEEKISIVPEKNSNPEPLIDYSKEAVSDRNSESHDLFYPEAKEENAEEICKPAFKKGAISRFFNLFACESKKQRDLSPSSERGRIDQSSNMDRRGLLHPQ